MGGRTRKVAKQIANNLKCDSIHVEELKYYTKATKMLSVQEEIVNGDLSGFTYDKKIEDLEPYDLILIGTPTWGSQPVPVFYGYLEKVQNYVGKKFILFNTCRFISIRIFEKLGAIIESKGGDVVKTQTFKGFFRIKMRKVEKFIEEMNQENFYL